MASTRPLIPPTNLKERIAALEQRTTTNANGGSGGSTRPTSPSPSVAPSFTTGAAAGAAPVGALRDKIAKFEKKGGVPVPRGSFGLGAPPTVEGPRRQGELYGNRIPAPARVLSQQLTGGSIPQQFTGGSIPPQYTGGIVPQFTGGAFPSRSVSPFEASPPRNVSADPRRSFSASSVMSDYDAQPDYTPVTSPTFAFPLESPDSLASVAMGLTPDGSPTANEPPVDTGTFRQTIIRGTSFQKALEIARTAELHEDAVLAELAADGRRKSGFPGRARTDSQGDVFQLPPEEEVGSPTTPTGRQLSLDSTMHDSPKQETKLLPSVEIPTAEKHSEEEAEVKTPVVEKPEPAAVEELAQPEPSAAAEVAKPPSPQIVVPDHATSSLGSPTTPTPDTALESVATLVESPIEPPPKVPTPEPIRIAPLAIRKRTATDPAAANAQDAEMPPVPKVEIQPPEIVIDSGPNPEQGKEDTEEKTKNAEIAARKAALTLDASKLTEASPISPPLTTGPMTAMSITDVLTNYFSSKTDPGDYKRPSTPPPMPNRYPESPLATIAYDNYSDMGTPPPALPVAKDKPANIVAPNPNSLLSPPPMTGLRSAALSSGGSITSMSSIGSRPMSMIETSPGHVSRALRMTPATSRGVPMFLGPTSTKTRKSDFVHFPPTPDADVVEEEGEGEFGMVTMDHRRRGSEPDLLSYPSSAKSATFRAVVHGRVRENPASATMPTRSVRALPETPHAKQVLRASILETPLSPGHGELAALLKEAVLLESTLDKGELPSESLKRIVEEEEQAAEVARKVAAKEEAKEREAERQRIAYATAQLQAKRDLPTHGRLKHTFLVPLSKAKTMYKKEAAIPIVEAPPRSSQESAHRPKSAGGQNGGAHSARQQLSQSSQSQSQNYLPPPKTPDASQSSLPLPSSAKSPKSSRFGGLKRLGSLSSRPNTYHDAVGRTSNSTASDLTSDDSAFAPTPPPENTLEFGTRPADFDHHGGVHGHSHANSMSFPSLSPKKSTSSMSRASSFAEKMWSRARTKSNGSVLSSTSEYSSRTHDGPPTLPPLGPPAINLPPTPAGDTNGSSIHPPARTSSLKRNVDLPPIPDGTIPPVPTLYHGKGSIDNNSLQLPDPQNSARPTSWTSISSAGSLPSPFFDKAIFDAFPSVPETTPAPAPATTLGHSFPHRRDQSLGAATVTMTSDFDAAFLSSAIHLAGSTNTTHASAYTKQPPASAAPAPMSMGPAVTPTPAGRRSAERPR